jgi:hypothetical protein
MLSILKVLSREALQAPGGNRSPEQSLVGVTMLLKLISFLRGLKVA